ncbi:hypothetical protein [Kitasatospora sp. NPDC048407]|uniref:hypothetical protein n=1 Tax=Kitasatospora sp. NPDC048407 TaxID=3364051 RepID=UPI00371F3F58
MVHSPAAGRLRDERLRTARRVVGAYLAEGFWRSTNPEAVRRVGNQHLSTYLTALVRHGFVLDAITEPAPGSQLAAAQPQRAGLPPLLAARAHRG